MRFVAHDLSLELVHLLREPLAQLRRHDAALARQAIAAVSSVALNLAESRGRVGRDRLHLVRVALGSLREVGAALDVAVAWGWLPAAPAAAERDRLAGMLYALQRG